VIEFGSAPRAITLGTGNGALDMNVGGGGGFSAYGADRAVSLNAGAALTWNSTADFLSSGQPLVLGSRTANATLDFQNSINLNNALRTVRTVDNPDSAGDMALLSAAVTGTGSSALRVEGDGTLVLDGANTFVGTTTVAGGALGGTGSLANNVTVEVGGVIAATSPTSPTGLQITGTLTVDGLIGVRLPTIAPGTYNVATASGGVTLNSNTVEPLPEDFVGTAWVDGNTLKIKVSSATVPTLILVR
jgi:autotransporter-associated beta strand protein